MIQAREQDLSAPLAGGLCDDCAAWLRIDDATLDGAELWFYGGTPPPEAPRRRAADDVDEHDPVALTA